jgi:hypothetical protein
MLGKLPGRTSYPGLVVRRVFAVVLLAASAVVAAACVGDAPSTEGGTPEPGTDATIADDGPPASDAGGDVPAVDAGPCDLAKPFVARGLVDDTTSFSDLWLAPDELSGVRAFIAPDGGPHRLYAIERVSMATPFSAGADVFGLPNGDIARGGTVSPDGKTLLFFSARDGVQRIYASKRPQVGDPWGAPEVKAVPGITDPWTLHPEWMDGQTVLVASDSYGDVDGGGKHLALYRAIWNGTAFTSSAEILELTQWKPVRASVSEGETAIVFGSAITGTLRIYDSRRVGAKFGDPAIVGGGVQTAAGEHPLYLSRDGCRMYYRHTDDARARLAVRE